MASPVQTEDYFSSITNNTQVLSNQIQIIAQTKAYFDEQITNVADENVSELINMCKQYVVNHADSTATVIRDIGLDLSCLLAYQSSRVQNLSLRVNSVKSRMICNEQQVSQNYQREITYLRSYIPRRGKLIRNEQPYLPPGVQSGAKYDHSELNLDALATEGTSVEGNWHEQVQARSHRFSVAPMMQTSIISPTIKTDWQQDLNIASIPEAPSPAASTPKDMSFFKQPSAAGFEAATPNFGSSTPLFVPPPSLASHTSSGSALAPMPELASLPPPAAVVPPPADPYPAAVVPPPADPYPAAVVPPPADPYPAAVVPPPADPYPAAIVPPPADPYPTPAAYPSNNYVAPPPPAPAATAVAPPPPGMPTFHGLAAQSSAPPPPVDAFAEPILPPGAAWEEPAPVAAVMPPPPAAQLEQVASFDAFTAPPPPPPGEDYSYAQPQAEEAYEPAAEEAVDGYYDEAGNWWFRDYDGEYKMWVPE